MFDNIFKASGLGLCLLSFLGLYGSSYWLLDLAVHFRWPYALGLALLTLFCGSPAMDLGSQLLSVMILNLYWLTLPFLWSRPLTTMETKQNHQTFKAMTVNIHQQNKEHAPFKQLIRSERPDFFVIQELTPERLPTLKVLQPAYNHIIHRAKSDHFGIIS